MKSCKELITYYCAVSLDRNSFLFRNFIPESTEIKAGIVVTHPPLGYDLLKEHVYEEFI
jgi:hypothetical protein